MKRKGNALGRFPFFAFGRRCGLFGIMYPHRFKVNLAFGFHHKIDAQYAIEPVRLLNRSELYRESLQLDMFNLQMRNDLFIADFACSTHSVHSFGFTVNEINLNTNRGK